jgi:hypothetical protein
VSNQAAAQDIRKTHVIVSQLAAELPATTSAKLAYLALCCLCARLALIWLGQAHHQYHVLVMTPCLLLHRQCSVDSECCHTGSRHQVYWAWYCWAGSADQPLWCWQQQLLVRPRLLHQQQ